MNTYLLLKWIHIVSATICACALWHAPPTTQESRCLAFLALADARKDAA